MSVLAGNSVAYDYRSPENRRMGYFLSFSLHLWSFWPFPDFSHPFPTLVKSLEFHHLQEYCSSRVFLLHFIEWVMIIMVYRQKGWTDGSGLVRLAFRFSLHLIYDLRLFSFRVLALKVEMQPAAFGRRRAEERRRARVWSAAERLEGSPALPPSAPPRVAAVLTRPMPLAALWPNGWLGFCFVFRLFVLTSGVLYLFGSTNLRKSRAWWLLSIQRFQRSFCQ